MSDEVVLADILERASRILTITNSISREEFMQSVLHQDAVIRSLEVIGEAANRLSDEFCTANPEMPVRDMVGIRNILIHNYSIVDLRIVWDTATKDIPHVQKLVEAILENEPV